MDIVAVALFALTAAVCIIQGVKNGFDRDGRIVLALATLGFVVTATFAVLGRLG